MSWPSKKHRWMRATRDAFTRLDAIARQTGIGRPLSIPESYDLANTLADLGRRGIELHPHGGERYQRGIENKTIQIEAGLRTLRAACERHGVPLLSFPKFESPWVPREGATPFESLDDLWKEFGLDEEEAL